MKRTVIIVLMAMAMVDTFAAITVNGQPATADLERGMLLCTVPEECFGRPFTAVVASDDPDDTVTVDGITAADGVYTFDDITHHRCHTIGVHNPQADHTLSLAFTFLPVVTLSGSFTDNYQPCTLTITLPGAATVDSISATGKHRGGITNQENSHKRNYHLKLVNKQGFKVNKPLLGMRDDNNWILDAGQIDLARIRNHVGMDLWREFSTPPCHSASTPGVAGGVHSEFVEMFVNGSYQGLYSLGEAIDRKQLRLGKCDEDTGEIHGVLWKSVGWEAPVPMNFVRADYDNYSDRWGGMELKYPDLDEVCPTDWTPLYEAAHFVATSSDDAFRNHVAHYFDLPVMSDYYLLCQLLKAVDNRGKNMYWFIHDLAADKRISVAPWDLDATAGQYWTNQWTEINHDEVNPAVAMPMNHRLLDRLMSLNPGGFATQTLRRYWQLRASTFTPDSLITRYTAPIERLQYAGTAQRETARWSGDPDIACLTLDFDGQKALFRQWFTLRIATLDQQFQYTEIRGDANGDRIVDVDDLNIIINRITGQRQPATIVSDATGNGVVDVNDVHLVVNIMVGKDE